MEGIAVRFREKLFCFETLHCYLLLALNQENKIKQMGKAILVLTMLGCSIYINILFVREERYMVVNTFFSY